ncbi:MAG: hypothetical protein WAM73_03375 [Desulfobacterales bacterium]
MPIATLITTEALASMHPVRFGFKISEYRDIPAILRLAGRMPHHPTSPIYFFASAKFKGSLKNSLTYRMPKFAARLYHHISVRDGIFLRYRALPVGGLNAQFAESFSGKNFGVPRHLQAKPPDIC